MAKSTFKVLFYVNGSKEKNGSSCRRRTFVTTYAFTKGVRTDRQQSSPRGQPTCRSRSHDKTVQGFGQARQQVGPAKGASTTGCKNTRGEGYL